MTDIRLSDDDWTKIRDFLGQDPHAYVGRDEQACRRFVEAVKSSALSVLLHQC